MPDIDLLDSTVIQQNDALARGGLGVEDRLEIDLVDAMCRLRCRPAAVRAAFIGIAGAPARDVDAGELVSRGAGAESDIVGIVIGQTRRAYALDEAQAAERFHRPRGDVIAFDARRLSRRPLFQDRDVNAPPGQIERQAEPHRPGAYDCNLRLMSHRARRGPQSLARVAGGHPQ